MIGIPRTIIAGFLVGLLAGCGSAPKTIEQADLARGPLPVVSKGEYKIQIGDELEHDGKCAYCDRRLGSYVRREGKLIRLVTNWDHFLPYSMTANNYGHNFVAACHICNGIKSSKVFQTLEEAREHVVSVAWAKGISDA